MKYALSTLIAAVSVVFCAPAVADNALDPTTSSAGVSLEVGAIDREVTLAANQPVLDVNADGAAAGANAHIQLGPFFRGEARVLSGELDFDTALGDFDETVSLLEARGTFGMEAGGGRVYTGAGVTYHTADFSTINWNTTTLYVPVGFAKSSSVGDRWTARTTFEGRVSVAGEEEIDNVPGFGNVTFDHGVGYGALVAMTFQHDSGVSVGGFFETVVPGDTDEEFGVLEAEDISNSTAGVRVGWSF